MHWKFLLFGITGNLAKIKILPGLAQFAQLNKDKTSVELVGYSRSQPKLEEVENALNSGIDTNTLKISENEHNLTKISFIQGGYEDGTVLFETISDLKKDERLVVYLAVPPSTFIKFLQNACPFSQNPIDVIVEKPFGRDPQEARQMLNLVYACNLHSQIHFCDHYLFKNSTLLNLDQKEQIQHFFQEFQDNSKNLAKELPSEQSIEALNQVNSDPSTNKVSESLSNPIPNQLEKSVIPKIKIHIKILEKVDLAGRAGYFDSTGAFKDMWPHLFSLLTLTLETTNLSAILSSLENLDKVKIEQVFLGQYATYCDEAGLEDSTTETFFKIKLNIDGAEIIMESGKNLPTKITEIDLTVGEAENTLENGKNQNKSKKMIWNIYPQQNLTLLNEQSTESIDNFDKQINRQTKFLADLSNPKLDQTNLFELLLNDEKQHFVTPEKISQSWQIWQKITDFIATNQVKIQIYQDQTIPKTD